MNPPETIADETTLSLEKVEAVESHKPQEFQAEEPLSQVEEPAEKKAPAAQVESEAYSGNLGQWLETLRICESGGDYQINTGNSFYGAYQFTKPTWDYWKTGYAYAHLAPASVQDATIIKNTNAASGGLATQNPGCYVKHGLSQFPPSN